MTPTNIDKKIGRFFKNSRECIGLNQEEVAKKMRMCRVSYTNLENGKANITVKHISTFSRALKLDPFATLNFISRYL